MISDENRRAWVHFGYQQGLALRHPAGSHAEALRFSLKSHIAPNENDFEAMQAWAEGWRRGVREAVAKL